jgi:hypothetical protein
VAGLEASASHFMLQPNFISSRAGLSQVYLAPSPDDKSSAHIGRENLEMDVAKILFIFSIPQIVIVGTGSSDKNHHRFWV